MEKLIHSSHLFTEFAYREHDDQKNNLMGALRYWHYGFNFYFENNIDSLPVPLYYLIYHLHFSNNCLLEFKMDSFRIFYV